MRRVFKRALWFYGILLAVGFCGLAAAELSSDEILRRADAIRTPSGDSLAEVHVVSVKPGRQPQTARYQVLLKGLNKTVIETLSPATDRGTSILMLVHDLWVFIPNVSKPVRISMQERLLGDVSNGDLARANFTEDYHVKIEQAATGFYVLNLTAKSEDVTYDRVRLWVERQTFRPLKAQFFASSGRLLKVGSYVDYRDMAGAVRPTRLVFSDAVVKGQQTTIYYDRMTLKDALPEKMFTKDYLKKLKY